MPITHQISSNPKVPLVPGGDIISQLQGLLGQAQGLLGSGMGLPGLQNIGSQLAGMNGAITAAGSSSSVNTSLIGSAIGGIGSQMASATSMLGISGMLSSLSSQITNLTNLLNPSGGLASVLHSHILDKGKGILASAFQGQHTTQWNQGGVTHSSSTAVTSSAPVLPHNGLTTVFTILGQAYGMLSDRRLKTNINDHPSVLEDVLKLRLTTFEIRSVDWVDKEITEEPPRPSFGLIAQEVQELFPSVVQDHGFLTIEESKIGMLLLGAFQEFVEETRREIADLRRELAMRL